MGRFRLCVLSLALCCGATDAQAGLGWLFHHHDRCVETTCERDDDASCFDWLCPPAPPTGTRVLYSIPYELDPENPFADDAARRRAIERRDDPSTGSGQGDDESDDVERSEPTDTRRSAVKPAPGVDDPANDEAPCTLEDLCARQKQIDERLQAIEKTLKKITADVRKMRGPAKKKADAAKGRQGDTATEKSEPTK